MVISSLQLDADTRTEQEILIDRARIDGNHEGIKRVIKEIEDIESFNAMIRQVTSEDFVRLKNKLGILVYKNWPNKCQIEYGNHRLKLAGHLLCTGVLVGNAGVAPAGCLQLTKDE